MFVGSQLPDLIDKPLAHELGVLPSGRVFMHSLPIALPVSAVALAYAVATGRRRLGGAFVGAYLLHLLGDTYRTLQRGTIPPDLLWPLVAPIPRPAVPYWAGPHSINLHLWTAFSGLVLGLGLLLLGRDVRRQYA